MKLSKLSMIGALSLIPVFGHDFCSDCPPTVSPAPTESPAPSPSPSEAPTDTQRPSVSLYPSTFPTQAPTTSAPSSRPSDIPTESPAPSPSPSRAPTLHPSMWPSVSFNPSISFQPSESLSPSKMPSAKPSNDPTPSPTSTPSAIPSSNPSEVPSISHMPSISFSPSDGHVFMIARDNEIAFEGFDSLLKPEGKEEFEVITLSYLSRGVPVFQGDNEVIFESVRVTDQSLHDESSEGAHKASLHLFFDVAAFVRFDGDIDFNYTLFVKTLFDDNGALEVLENKLKNISDMLGNTSDILGNTSEATVNANEEILDKAESATTKSNKTMLLAIVGVSLLVGSFGACVWYRSRRNVAWPAIEQCKHSSGSYDIDEYPVTMKPTESYDSASLGYPENISEASYPSAGFPIAEQFQVKSRIPTFELNTPPGINKADSIDTRYLQEGPSAMYRPAFLPTESNIEIPITPMTNYDASQFSPSHTAVSDLDIELPTATTGRQEGENGRVNEQSRRLFGISRKKRRSHEKSSVEEPEHNLPSAHHDSMISGSRQKPWDESFDQSNSTISSILFRPTKFLKTVWQASSNDLPDEIIPEESEIHLKHLPEFASMLRDHGIPNESERAVQRGIYEAKKNSPSCRSNATSIKVMNEVAYLHSQDLKKDETIAKI